MSRKNVMYLTVLKNRKTNVSSNQIFKIDEVPYIDTSGIQHKEGNEHNDKISSNIQLK